MALSFVGNRLGKTSYRYHRAVSRSFCSQPFDLQKPSRPQCGCFGCDWSRQKQTFFWNPGSRAFRSSASDPTMKTFQQHLSARPLTASPLNRIVYGQVSTHGADVSLPQIWRFINQNEEREREREPERPCQHTCLSETDRMFLRYVTFGQRSKPSRPEAFISTALFWLHCSGRSCRLSSLFLYICFLFFFLKMSNERAAVKTLKYPLS